MMRLRTVQINTQARWGGGERQTLLLARGLARAGHEAVLATRPGSPLGERAREAGIPILPIDPVNEIDPRAIWRLARLLRRLRPDVIHMHSPHALFLGALAARLAPGTARVVSRRVARSIYRPLTLRLNWIKYRLGADHVIAVSNAVAERLVRDGVRTDRISVVHSGVDPDEIEPLRAGPPAPAALAAGLGLDRPPERPLVVSAGALHHVKGTEVLLEAARRVTARSDAAFVIAGDGPLRRRIEARIRDEGLQGRVVCPGFRRDPLSLLAAATVFVQPSLSEGLGTSILDALLLERAVVASRAGGIPEIIEDGREGVLVPPGDAPALAAAILDLLAAPGRRGALGTRGRRTVLERFTAERMVEETISVYAAIRRPPAGR